MAAVVLFSIWNENDNANRLTDPENLYIAGFKIILLKN